MVGMLCKGIAVLGWLCDELIKRTRGTDGKGRKGMESFPGRQRTRDRVVSFRNFEGNAEARISDV